MEKNLKNGKIRKKCKKRENIRKKVKKNEKKVENIMKKNVTKKRRKLKKSHKNLIYRKLMYQKTHFHRATPGRPMSHENLTAFSKCHGIFFHIRLFTQNIH